MMKYDYLVFFSGTVADKPYLMFGKGNLELDRPITSPEDCAKLELFIKEQQEYETLTLTGLHLVREWDNGIVLSQK